MSAPFSMTCFGRGESAVDGRTWTVEVRSVNHRYCDVSVRLPRFCGGLEERVKKEVTALFNRGKVDVSINCRGEGSDSVSLHVDQELARRYHACLVELKNTFALAGDPDLAILASFRDVIAVEERVEDLDALWAALLPALQAALAEGLAMRRREGEALKSDLTGRLRDFAGVVEEIAGLAAGVAAQKADQLRERITQLLGDIEIDPVRFAQEVALLADRVDVSEEIVRLRSHIDQFAAFLEQEEPVGRRLDFLLQEFFREINTVASKISTVEVTHRTVDLKNEVEKMREQVQNLV
ncbi:MAG: YicC/YloC family endoribonuclease [Thermodesulfobacteriota bacterium]